LIVLLVVAALAAIACTPSEDVAEADVRPSGTTSDPSRPTLSGLPSPSPLPIDLTVEVPRLVGRQLGVAKALIRKADLRLSRDFIVTLTDSYIGVKRIPSSKPEGTVLKQSVAPGKDVREGLEIRLVVSDGLPVPCHPSYTPCVPPPPPYLDCDDVPYNNIAVRPPDPHGFDGYDNDGWGCET
jgi:beta-lactam-binding protein with PASTA domain